MRSRSQDSFRCNKVEESTENKSSFMLASLEEMKMNIEKMEKLVKEIEQMEKEIEESHQKVVALRSRIGCKVDAEVPEEVQEAPEAPEKKKPGRPKGTKVETKAKAETEKPRKREGKKVELVVRLLEEGPKTMAQIHAALAELEGSETAKPYLYTITKKDERIQLVDGVYSLKAKASKKNGKKAPSESVSVDGYNIAKNELRMEGE